MEKKDSATRAVYRVWYGDVVAYVGRTNRPVRDRIREHLTSAPSTRSVDPKKVTKIEYATFERQADAYLYEIFYICLFRPPLNVDDLPSDEPSVRLPDVEWIAFPADELARLKEKASKTEALGTKEKKASDEAKDRSDALWKIARREKDLREALRALGF